MILNRAYAKAITTAISVVSSLVGALLTQGLLHGTAQTWATVVVSLLGVLGSTAGVYLVPNAKAPQPVPPSPASMLHPFDAPVPPS